MKDQRNERMARSALVHYGVSAADLELIRAINNTVFAVMNDRKEPQYVLRLHRTHYRSLDHVRSELQYLEYLGIETGFRVPSCVRNIHGELVTELAGYGDEPILADLLTWVPGQIRRPGSGLGSKACYQLGETLAVMHLRSQGFSAPSGFEFPRWDGDALFTGASRYAPGEFANLLPPDDADLFTRTERRARSIFEVLDGIPGQEGVIHADFILGNCRFQGGKVGVLDFDDCGYGYFLYDLCTLLGNLSEFPEYGRRRRAFLAGYRSRRPLPAGLEEQFGVLMSARHAGCVLWAAGLLRRGAWSEQQVREHIAYRISEMRRLLVGTW